MAEKTTPVFVYATANDVSALPPELLRKGRFDEMFSVDLPHEEERKEILSIHLRKKNRSHLIGKKPGQIDLDQFAGEPTKGFSGAEIEAALVEALYSAFDAGKELNQFDLQNALEDTTPLSKTMSEKIAAIRKWCEARTRPANRQAVERSPLKGRTVEA